METKNSSSLIVNSLVCLLFQKCSNKPLSSEVSCLTNIASKRCFSFALHFDQCIVILIDEVQHFQLNQGNLKRTKYVLRRCPALKSHLLSLITIQQVSVFYLNFEVLHSAPRRQKRSHVQVLNTNASTGFHIYFGSLFSHLRSLILP